MDVNVKNVKVWTDIAGNTKKREWQEASSLHQMKLQKFREQKKYQQWIDETEEDIEAEKIMADIENLQEEKLYNVLFCRNAKDVYHGMDQR